MLIREATVADIPGMQIVRRAVKENRLSRPDLIQDHDYVPFITEKGKGWVSIVDEIIVGFAIADLQEQNIWALFVLPEWEGRGIGSQLHDTMMEWYFSQTAAAAGLSTAMNTRAAEFYRKKGWQETGDNGKGELLFELKAWPTH